MQDKDIVVGIDLGTTFSEITAFVDGKVVVLGPGDKKMLPSCVGITPAGELLVGEPARNQQKLYPDRTVSSIKRKMGDEEKVTLGDKSFTPQEISSLILRHLAEWASQHLDKPVKKAVITVPAYFSDAQRNATREAGALAGLEVVRILNEPTAASLAYGNDEEKKFTTMIYDLGGGTFDVSIVTIENDVTEVLASHGNNHLGGDDFDQLIMEKLIQEFQETEGINLLGKKYAAARSRLRIAAEEAKKKLSFDPYARIREEGLAEKKGASHHLDMELSREEYEKMIRSLVETTLESVEKAMDDAGMQYDQLDAVLLVGGSTRTPLVMQILEEHTGQTPRQEVHPDLCVALGAGVLASRLAGQDVERVLVDISPYSFGPSHLGTFQGLPYRHCYTPIIRRNTPLPVSRMESYYTVVPDQDIVQIKIYQGEDPDAMKNIPVGDFRIKGLKKSEEKNEVLCRMQLNIDGILQVTAIEKQTGKSKQITINNAFQQMSEAEIAKARKRLGDLYMSLGDIEDENWDDEFPDLPEVELDSITPIVPMPDTFTENDENKDPDWQNEVSKAKNLIERSRLLFNSMHEEDQEEAVNLHEQIESAIASEDIDTLKEDAEELRELLFFIEGK